MTSPQKSGPKFVDRFDRTVTYLRLSVTDRCDLRCTYCMAEHMQFLPRKEVLSLEELYRVASVFMDHGVRKIRITGGEPLVRKDVLSLFECLSHHLETGEIDEITLTTNGTQLARHAKALKARGVERINVSLDTLDPDRYRQVTRLGDINKVLAGIEAAQKAGLQVKINAVASKGQFEHEVDDLIRFAHSNAMDITFIEEMPLGITGTDRWRTYLPTHELQKQLRTRWELIESDHKTGGPATYLNVKQTGGRVGFIAPMSCNFCSACNRVRVDCTGRLFTCMGKEGSIDLRSILRTGEDSAALTQAIRSAVFAKPKGHAFDIGEDSVEGIDRHMSTLGG